jgi:hypothetical protein
MPPRSTTIRFDLVTVFSFVTLWALFLGAMRVLQFPLYIIYLFSILLLAVCVSRFLLRWFSHPHLASIVVGVFVTLAGEATLRIVQGLPTYINLGLVVVGIAYGVIADILVTAAVLLPVWVKRGLTRRGS